jgi:xanthine dehydrogenase accessory factor
MMAIEQTHEIQRLTDRREPFVVATVVRARRPTSVRPGDCAIVHADGRIDGFVGGVCAESSVRLHALRALETGDPLLLALVPEDGEGANGTAEGSDGAIVERNPCLSGGSLEIFLEPHLPASLVLVIGSSPIARALVRLAEAAGYDARLTPAGAPDVADAGGAAAVVVASHGAGEEQVLAEALRAGVPYVALVASPRRGAAVREALEVPGELVAQLHSPAGLDIGARTPTEIAVSILAEMVAGAHAHPPLGEPAGRSTTVEVEVVAPSAVAIAVDPVCGMSVAAVGATPHLEVAGETVWFCGEGCRDRYAATL